MIENVLTDVLGPVIGFPTNPFLDPDLLVDFRAGRLTNYGVEGGSAALDLTSGTVQKSYLDASGVLRFMDQDAGLRPLYVDGEYRGDLRETGVTNKCTCAKFNPSDTTNIGTPTNDGVLSIVNDAAELALAGLSEIGPAVYKLDNTSGETISYCVVSGNTGNTNPHSMSVWARGNGSFGLANGVGAEGFDTEHYELIKAENVTPTNINLGVKFQASAGALVYFTFPQLEESTFCTSPVGSSSTGVGVRYSEMAKWTWAMTDAVKAALGSIDSPVGDEVVDDVTAWAGSIGEGWTDDGVNAVSASSPAVSAAARKEILEAGKTYRVTMDVVLSAGEFKVQGNTHSSSAYDVASSGSYEFLIYSDGVHFKIIATTDANLVATITNISVKPLQPQGTLIVEWTPMVSKADVAALSAIQGIVGVRDFAASVLMVATNGALQTTDATTYLGNASTDYSAGDFLTTKVTWDGEATSDGLTIATTLDGSTETDSANFDGAFTLGDDLILGYGTGFPFAIKSIKLRKGVS